MVNIFPCGIMTTELGQNFSSVYSASKNGSRILGAGARSYWKSASDQTYIPINLPIRPVQIIEIRYTCFLAYDSSGHIYVVRNSTDGKNNPFGIPGDNMFHEFDNLEVPIERIWTLGDENSFFYDPERVAIVVNTSSQSILYSFSNNKQGYKEKCIFSQKIDNITELASASEGQYPSYLFRIGNKVYQKYFLDLRNTSLAGYKFPEQDLLFSDVKELYSQGSYFVLNRSSDGCAYILRTDGTLERYYCPVTEGRFDSFSRMTKDETFDLGETITKIEAGFNIMSTDKVFRDSIRSYYFELIAYGSSGNVYILPFSNNESVTITNTFLNITGTFIHDGSANYRCFLSNGTVQFSNRQRFSSSEYYDTATNILQLPSKIIRISGNYYQTQDNRIFLANGSKLQEITSFNVTGAGYYNSELRSTLNSFLTCLPSDLKSVLTNISKKTTDITATVNLSNYSNVMSKDIKETSDKIFTLSEYEVLGKDYTITVDGKTRTQSDDKNYQQQYAYYKNGASLKRVAHNDSTKQVEWWTRTPHLYEEGKVAASSFNTTATAATAKPNHTNQRTSLGIVPCFGIAADIS